MHNNPMSLQNTLHDLADIGVRVILSEKPEQDYHAFASALPNYNMMRLIELIGGDVPERERILNAFKLYIPNNFRPALVAVNPQIQPHQTITPKKIGDKPYHNIVRPTPVQYDTTTKEPDITNILERATEISNSAHDIMTLKNVILGFKTGTELQELARQTIFFDGNPEADIMIIGDCPDHDDDATGLPFSGQSGKILDIALETLGFSRESSQKEKSVCMLNMIFWRVGGRKATPTDYKICLPFVIRAIELVNPKKIILMGAVGLELLLDMKTSLMAVRGEKYDYVIEDKIYPIYVTFPPHYIMQMPLAKKEFWFDMIKSLLTP